MPTIELFERGTIVINAMMRRLNKIMHIDLSVPRSEQTPVYPSNPTTKVESAGILNKDGYNGHNVSLGNYTYTHIDAYRASMAQAPLPKDASL
jgi:hypothetical protein